VDEQRTGNSYRHLYCADRIFDVPAHLFA